MKKSLFLTLAIASACGSAFAQTQPTIYGSVIFGHGWEDMGSEAPFGIYSLPANDATQMKSVKLDDNLSAFGGGVYVDGRYYMVDYSPYDYDGTVSFRVYDVDAGWRLIEERHLATYSSVASDLAYDPTTDRVYGCFRESATTNGYFFGTLNTITGFSSKIADLKQELIALAATKDGRLYGISIYGMLYSVDKNTGELTEIGQTGKTVKYAQSATFDYPSGRMLWAMTPHYTHESPEICEVNLTDGTVTTLTTIPDRYEFTGIYTTGSYADDNAPARPTSLKASLTGTSLTGKALIAMPDRAAGGGNLASSLGYKLWMDGNLLKEGQAQAGAGVEAALTLTRGMHHMKAVATNSAGRSQFAYCDFWAGSDVVNAVSPKAVMKDAQTVSVSWTAPQRGNHDGYFDPSLVTYTVTRQPDAKVVYDGSATSFDDKEVADLQMGYYYYEVAAKVAGEYGDKVRTNVVQVGSALKLPYDQPFNDEVAAKTMTVIDANEDDETWQFFGDCFICGVSQEGLDDDDWLVTPAFNLSKDSVYQVSMDVKAEEGYCETVAVAAGQKAEAASLTQTVLAPMKVDNVNYRTLSAVFAPKHDGACHIGVHALSLYAEGSYLYLDNLKVKCIGSVKCPGAVTEAKAEPVGASTDRKVEISFKAPVVNMGGETLTANLKHITVKRLTDNKVVETFSNIIPGDICQMTDTPSADGTVSYEITAENAVGKGETVTVSTYVGLDQPGAVENLRISSTDDGQVTASWDAPSKGKHGGLIDKASLKYNIANVDGSSLKSTTVSEPSFSEQMTMKGDEQRLAWYVITSRTQQGKGIAVSTDTIFVGKPYAVPYAESFAKRSMQRGPWYGSMSALAEWNIMQYGTYADAADLDNGFIAFSTVTTGASSDFIGPKITLKDTHNPRLTFYVWNMKRSVHHLRVALRTPDGKRHQLDDILPNDFDGEDNDGRWLKYSYSLSDLRSYEYVQLIFTGVGGNTEDLTSIVPLYVDQINVDDPLSFNLTMGDVSAMIDKVSVGDDVTVFANISNTGDKDAADFDICLYRGETLVGKTHVDELAAGQNTDVELKDAPNSDAALSSLYHAEIAWDSDEEASDNVSKNVVVTVLPGRPFVKDAKAEAADDMQSVALSWSEPEGISNGAEAEDVVEDFESYVPFTISHFGEWTLMDIDGASTLGIQDGSGDFVQYDNVEAPMAFQVFNPSAVSLSPLYFPTHSGEQVAAAFSAGRYTANDDWLISPEVDGAQTITFWACSPNNNYYGTQEQMEVLCSVEGKSIGSFKKVGSTITVPGQWTQYSADLPEGARYFALRCTSKDQYILFVDDIKYRKAGTGVKLLGYNVYRDGTRLNASPITATKYTDNRSVDTDVTYSVKAVYNTGESRAANAVWDSASGIDGVGVGNAVKHVRIYDISGRQIPLGSSLKTGVYIVWENGKAHKICIK